MVPRSIPFIEKQELKTILDMGKCTHREILSVGNDIVDVRRIKKLINHPGGSFIRRCYTDREIKECTSRAFPYIHFAGKWAAKEAVYKALNLKWNRPFSWKEIEIHGSETGEPGVVLSDSILQDIPGQSISELFISLSHCDEYAFAVVITFKDPEAESKADMENGDCKREDKIPGGG